MKRGRSPISINRELDSVPRFIPVVLVVSEETGDISVAERGQLIRKLNPENLRGLLTELLGRGDPNTFQKAAA